jgi:NAD(P)-dependent dehydrogenase (short-subunit alcohol dehydrogenase family)
LPVELSDLKSVRRFAQQALEKLGDERIDYLLLNAAIADNAEKPGDGWCETYIVNHLCEFTLCREGVWQCD